MQDAIASGAQDGIASDIALRSDIVRVPVDLKDEHVLSANEVSKKRRNLDLPTEPDTEPRIRQVSP